MTLHEYRLGIDFGTSSTVAALAAPDRPAQPLLFDASPLLASAVFAAPDGSLLTGRDAVRAAAGGPGRYEANPKRRIDDGAAWLGERDVPVVEMISAVLARVGSEAERVAGGRPGTVVLSHPAGWGPVRRGVLSEAAERAGLGSVALVPEPVAAAVYFVTVLGHDLAPGHCVVIYDLGAGTFDVAVVRRTADGFEVLAADGLDDVGGLDFDAAVLGHARELGGGDPQAHDAWGRVDWPQTDEDQHARQQAWSHARDTKEQLSRHVTADLHVPLVGATVHITREEFERAVRPHLDRTVALTVATLRAARVAPDAVAGVFLVGGSSRIPLAATLLHRALRVAPVAIDQPELVVAVGSLRAVAADARPAPAPPEPPAEKPQPPAEKPQPDVEEPQPDVAAAAPDVDRIQRLADALTDPADRARALGALAAALAGTDPAAAARLADRAAQAAGVVDPSSSSWRWPEALAGLGASLATFDPGRAEGVAETVADPVARAGVLLAAAAAAGPEGADRLRRLALRAVGQAVRRAPSYQRERLMTALAPVDPDRAVKLARDNVDRKERATALAKVAAALAERHPAGAARALAQARDVAGTIHDVWQRQRTVNEIAQLVVAYDPSFTELVAQQQHDGPQKAEALAAVAQVVLGHDPEQARRLVEQAQRIADRLDDAADRASALVAVGRPLARLDPDRAEDIARTCAHRSDSGLVLAELAAGAAGGDRDRAERLAGEAVDATESFTPSLIKVIEVLAAADPELAWTTAERVADESARSTALATALVALVGPPRPAAPPRPPTRRIAFWNR